MHTRSEWDYGRERGERYGIMDSRGPHAAPESICAAARSIDLSIHILRWNLARERVCRWRIAVLDQNVRLRPPRIHLERPVANIAVRVDARRFTCRLWSRMRLSAGATGTRSLDRVFGWGWLSVCRGGNGMSSLDSCAPPQSATVSSKQKIFTKIQACIQNSCRTMSAIGSLVFCTDCGTLLDSSSDQENPILVCDVCGARCKGTNR